MGGGRAYKKKTKVRTLRNTGSKSVAEEYTKEFRNNGYNVVPWAGREEETRKTPKQEHTPQQQIIANPNEAKFHRPYGFYDSSENAPAEYAARILHDRGYSIVYRKRADGKNYSYYDDSKKEQVFLTADELLELGEEVLRNEKAAREEAYR